MRIEALLGALRSVFAAALLPVLHSPRVKRTPHYMIPDSREVFNPAPSYQDDRVLLEIMPLARDVGANFNPVRQPHPRNFSQSRVRFLRVCSIDADANPSLQRTGNSHMTTDERVPLPAQSPTDSGLRLLYALRLSPFPDKLAYRWHLVSILIRRQDRRHSNCADAPFRNSPGGESHASLLRPEI